MHLGRITMSVAATAAFSAAAMATTSATSAAEDVATPTYKEFKAQTFRDGDRQFIVNGDEPISKSKDLRTYFEKITAPAGGHSDLVVNTVGGVDDKWTASAARNLTYCVSTKFGTQQQAVINAFAAGAATWETASSGVNFTYLPAQNSTCTTRNTNVVFSVEPTTTTQYIARAFFPSSAKNYRNVLVNANALQNSGSWTPANIVAHELGHVLGFRHEHTRPEAGTCFEDTNWRPLTPYDSVSIMHYPQCNGGSTNLTFSANDRVGVQALYGS